MIGKTAVPSDLLPKAAGTRSSVVVDRCQACDAAPLEPILFLGFLPPVNEMPPVGKPPKEQPSYPAQLLRCPRCELVQLGLIVDPQILFPPEYPYTSGTTKLLCDNFAELYRDCRSVVELGRDDLIVDVGSNDGTLLSNFAKGHKVLGIEPTGAGDLAAARGIPTLKAFFGPETARRVRAEHGPARVVTAANVFAHMEGVHGVVEGILAMLAEDGVFISESHYLASLVETLQYDTVYHEHLRYYSLASLKNLLESHGLAVVHAKKIPTHGGSIRVYATRTGRRGALPSVAALLSEERRILTPAGFADFRRRVVKSKLALCELLSRVKSEGARVYAVGAPSRASTLINYVGLDDGVLDCVLEIKGSRKIGKYMPGTLVPVVEESQLFNDQPEYALLLSWHLADELAPKLKEKGFRGRFIVPLPEPRILS